MKSVGTYVWIPTWCILSAGTVLRLHRHELGDLTTGKRHDLISRTCCESAAGERTAATASVHL